MNNIFSGKGPKAVDFSKTTRIAESYASAFYHNSFSLHMTQMRYAERKSSWSYFCC